MIIKIELIKRIDRIIANESSGNPKEFSNKLRISEAQLYRILNHMKSLGAPIYYCKYKLCYKYESPVEFIIGFE